MAYETQVVQVPKTIEVPQTIKETRLVPVDKEIFETKWVPIQVQIIISTRMSRLNLNKCLFSR